MSSYAIELKVQTRLPYDEVVKAVQSLYDFGNVAGTFKAYRNSLFDYDNVVIQFARELTEDHPLIEAHMRSMRISAYDAAVYQLKLEVEDAVGGNSEKVDFYDGLMAAFANRERYCVDFRGAAEPDPDRVSAPPPAQDNELAGRVMMMQQMVKDLSDKVAMSESLKSLVVAINERMREIEEKLNEGHERFDNIDQKLREHEQQLETQSQAINELDRTIDRVNERLDSRYNFDPDVFIKYDDLANAIADQVKSGDLSFNVEVS